MLYTLVIDRKNEPEQTDGTLPDGLLTAEETAVYQSLKTEKRRRDWLHGRYTAKWLVKQVFQEEFGCNIDTAEFAVLRKESGAPAVRWLNGNGRPPVTLSISHSCDRAFCSLWLKEDAYLGCDMEMTVPRSPLFVTDYLTDLEQKLVGRTHATQRTVLVNTIWSAKEAVLKALELGLRVDTRAVTCLPVLGLADCWQPIVITLDADRITGPVPTLAGRWRLKGPFVFTVVAPAVVWAAETIREMEKFIDD